MTEKKFILLNRILGTLPVEELDSAEAEEVSTIKKDISI